MEETAVVTDGDRDKYLTQLLSYLDAARDFIAADSSFDFPDFLKDFGTKNDWQWERIPFNPESRTISDLIGKIASDYRWLQWNTTGTPDENMGYFDSLRVNTYSGLPSSLDFFNLHRARKNAGELLVKLPSYQDLIKQYRLLLMGDDVIEDKVPSKVRDLQVQAMKRNFLEHLKDARMTGWDADYCDKPKVTKRQVLGPETLWNIVCCNYNIGFSMFEIGIFDIWQDEHLTQEITEKGVSDSFHARIKGFHYDNTAWQVLRSVDEAFEYLHPVHVTRVLVGPYENAFRHESPDRKMLPIAKAIQEDDPFAALLRVSIQYTYAPNPEPAEKYTLQKLHLEDWRDELVVCPSRYSKRVADSVLGTRVHIIGR